MRARGEAIALTFTVQFEGSPRAKIVFARTSALGSTTVSVSSSPSTDVEFLMRGIGATVQYISYNICISLHPRSCFCCSAGKKRTTVRPCVEHTHTRAQATDVPRSSAADPRNLRHPKPPRDVRGED